MENKSGKKNKSKYKYKILKHERSQKKQHFQTKKKVLFKKQ